MSAFNYNHPIVHSRAIDEYCQQLFTTTGAVNFGYIDIKDDQKLKQKKVCHYYFASKKNNHNITTFYLNNSDKLVTFCNDFYQKFTSFIQTLEPLRIDNDGLYLEVRQHTIPY